MKKIMKFWISAIIAMCCQSQASFAQTINEERMRRDIEIAESVLATLIKRELDHQNSFFGMDVRGSYQPGYGVTFRIPADQSMPFVFSLGADGLHGTTVISDGSGARYTIRTNGSSEDKPGQDEKAIALKDRSREKKQSSLDSTRRVYNDLMIKAAQVFILDYGDLMSQLGPNEKIVVTNQNDQHHFLLNQGKRTRISVEGSKADVTAFKQGKISHDQALKKLTLINTESVPTKDPDMEMISSIFSRLYRPDLSKTYFVDGNVYYERLKDYGAIFYMQMFSSVEKDFDRFNIPTLALEDVNQDERDKKVIELYPAFEQDVKENILEYGRTVKSLKDEELLIFNISLTKCKGCGIPSTLEVSIKSSVLKDFGAGKIDRSAAMNKFNLKKGANQ